MSLAEQRQNFAADVKRDVYDCTIKEYERKMPIRLIDTYTGLILKRSEITSLLQERSEYRARLNDAVQGPYRPRPIEPPSQHLSRLDHLEAFIAEYLAFAMFSHRWGKREVTINDVREARRGIYSIAQAPHDLSGKHATDFLDGAKKLQEFCCAAAKCGFRWAWSDACCIDDQVYGERSESLNSMFLWYSSSDLTIVYLGDVDDVKAGRFFPEDDEDVDPLFNDLEIQNPFPTQHPSSYPSSQNTPDTVTLHDCSQERPLRFQSLRPDTQVEATDLEDHLKRKFPCIPHWLARHIYHGLPAWVTRGWTLQEMLASKRLRFYSKDWKLLEGPDDSDFIDEEIKFSISSFRYRARMLNHRASPIWLQALHDATGVPKKDIIKFEAGTKDVRDRLLWAARRRTEKVEDVAYCLLGIFDVSLPAMYGEGHRAFSRLQEELIKRTGDTSLFDWCGPSCSANTFLAYRPECFIEPNHPAPHFDDWSGSTFRMIVDVVCVILGTVLTGVQAAAREVLDWVKNILRSPPPGHILVNGELSLSWFEHQVKCCEPVESCSSEDTHFHYKLEAEGLKPTNVTLESRSLSLENKPTEYYLCRVWNQHTHNVFQILVELMEYILKDSRKELWSSIHDESAKIKSGSGRDPIVENEADEPEPKLRAEMETKRKQVLGFFKGSFPVYLVRVRDGRRVRVSTVRRVLTDYTQFTFTMPVVTRLIL